jgi:hypothetical protein
MLLSNANWSIAQFVPSLQYSYTLNSSNVPFYDFDAHGITFALSRDF